MNFKVLILNDLLSVRTGTMRVAIDLARSFISCGDTVKLIFFHSDNTVQLFGDELNGLDITIIQNRFAYGLSKLVQLPILRLFMRDAFTDSDSINIMGQILFIRQLQKLQQNYDFIIFLNIWSSISSVFLGTNAAKKSAIYFHEPPTFFGLPFFISYPLKIYLSRILNHIRIKISITDTMRNRILSDIAVDSLVLNDYFIAKSTNFKKQDYVLLDTRWTLVRTPFFLIDIMKLTNGIKFKMCGVFGSPSLKREFLNRVKEEHLSDRIVLMDSLEERVLNDLYANARCYLRWSNPQIQETGPSYGLIKAVSNCCIPVVSKELGSASDVIRNLGDDFVVPFEPHAFSKIILRLFSDNDFYEAALNKVIKWRDSYTSYDYRNRLVSYFLNSRV